MNDMIDTILEPIDHRRVWWRKFEPLPQPQTEWRDWGGFKAMVEKAASKNSHFTFDVHWYKVDLPLTMSRKEAHFWLTLMLNTNLNLRDVSYDPMDYDDMTIADIKAKFAQSSQYSLPSKIVIPLHILFDVKDYIPLLLSLTYTHFAFTWAEIWLPYLKDYELEMVRQMVRPLLQPILHQYKLPAYNSTALPAPVVWAMHCGLGQDLYHVVSKCEDGYYADRFGRMKLLKGNNCADVILSLPSHSAVVEEMKRVKLALCEPYQVRWWLAHTGTSELEYVRDSITIEKGKIRAKRLIEILGEIKTVEVAGYIFELMSNNVSTAYAQSWLLDNPELTVQALIPFAQGLGKQADLARNHLRVMIRDGHEELVEKYAEPALIDKLIDRTVAVSAPLFDKNSTPDWLDDGLNALDKKTTSPRWVTPTTLPPLVADGHQLTEKQVKGVLRAFKASETQSHHVLADDLQKHGDRHLLDNFLWRLMEQWKLNGERKQEVWAFYAVIRFGTDKLLIRLTPILKEMTSRRRSKRNIRLIVLGALHEIANNASDTAYMQLESLRPTFHAKRRTEMLDKAIDKLARRRKVSLEELKDLAVPDCGLDENGTRLFDYGRRQFTVVIGTDLTPMIRDDNGKIRKNLPKPGKTDDHALAEPAYESWKFIKKQIRDTIKRQTPRLEQAMIFERRWSPESFDTLFLNHPTMRHIARDFVWGAYRDRQVVCTFRITPQGQFVDYMDKPVSIPKNVSMGIVHPVHVDPETAQHWQDLLLDFEIIPLFPQMNRPVYRVPEKFREASEINPQEFNNAQLHILAVRTSMFKAGYSEGYGYAFGRYFPRYNVTVLIRLDEVDHGVAHFETARYFSSLRFSDGMRPQSHNTKYNYMPLKDVPSLVMSEAIYDLSVTLA